jgi:lipoprotein-anchoring transpeptidase ErfK/SrfK
VTGTALLAGAAFAAGAHPRAVHHPTGLATHQPRRPFQIPVSDIPTPARQALTVGSPEDLPTTPGASRWAALKHATLARSRPSTHARTVARLSAHTPEGTTNIVVVVGSAHDASGALWLRVRLPSLKATTGWVPRGAVGTYGTVHTRLIVDRAKLRLTLMNDGKVAFRAPIGVGKRSTPTPAGIFYIRDKVTRYASAFYGPIAFGTSARSHKLTDWPAGGFIGIHGTDQPKRVPGHVSHGCIRMRNADIVKLAAMLPVGTPVEIH